MAVAASKLGQFERATALLDEAERLPQNGSVDVASLATYAAQAGEHERALRLLATIEDQEYREKWLGRILWILAESDGCCAEGAARTTTELPVLCSRLVDVAMAVKSRDRDRAVRLSAEADRTAQSIDDPAQRREALITVAAAFADLGDVERAVTLAREYAESGIDANAVFYVAAAAFRFGDQGRGGELLDLTEDVARRVLGAEDQRRSVMWIRTMADFEDFDRAEAHARLLVDCTARSAAWAAIAEGAVAAQSLDRAENALAAIDDASLRRRPRLDLIRAALAAREPAAARVIAKKTEDIEDRATALLLVARDTRNADVLDEVDQLIESSPEPDKQMNMLLEMVEVTAALGDRARTRGLLDRLGPIAKVVIDADRDDRGLHRRWAGDVMDLCAARMRTMTEVIEAVLATRRFDLARPTDRLMSMVPTRFPMTTTKGLTQDRALAQQLVEHDWGYVVAELVELCPAAYPAIVAEVDRLAAPAAICRDSQT